MSIFRYVFQNYDLLFDHLISNFSIILFQVGEPIAISYILNVGIINVLWTIASGRRLHSQQQEFQSVYECIEKITQFMSKAAIMSFMPFLARLLPESITKMEKGRYYRNRFIAISEVKYVKSFLTLPCKHQIA